MNTGHLIYLVFLIELFLAGFWYTGSAVTQAFLVVAVVVGARAVMTRGAVLAYAMSGLMLLYLAWLFIAAWNSHLPYVSMMTLATLANLPVMYLVASNTPSFAAVWKYLRIAFFVIGVFFALWALWQAVHDQWYGAVVGPLHDSNLFAAMINVLWFPAAFLFLNSSGHFRKKILLGSGLFIMSAALFATASRGGIGTWILLLPVLLWAGYRNLHARRSLVHLLLIAFSAYIFSAYLVQIGILDRNFLLSQDASFSARLLLWQSSVKMMSVHPLTGFGWGAFASYYPVYRSPLEDNTAGFFAHNDYLQLAVEGGFTAMFLLLGLLMTVLMQLKRSLKRAYDEAGLERVALLLGVLALLIHAGVNFIFYIAFMNILAGLYLARAAQLAEVPRQILLENIQKISLPARRFFIGLALLFMLVPLAPNLVAEFLNQQSNIKAANLLSSDINAYTVAEYITKLKPEASVAQEIVLRTAEAALADQHFLSKFDVAFQRELLNETLQRFETVRALTANNPKLGVRQAKMLIEHHAILDADAARHITAYEQAHQVLGANLKADPYHADSIILLSRLYGLQGKRTEALQVLKPARHRVFGYINQQLIAVETLRQLASPQVIPELDVIEKQLYQVRSDGQVFRLSVMAGGLDADIDARLSRIGRQISAMN